MGHAHWSVPVLSSNNFVDSTIQMFSKDLHYHGLKECTVRLVSLLIQLPIFLPESIQLNQSTVNSIDLFGQLLECMHEQKMIIIPLRFEAETNPYG